MSVTANYSGQLDGLAKSASNSVTIISKMMHVEYNAFTKDWLVVIDGNDFLFDIQVELQMEEFEFQTSVQRIMFCRLGRQQYIDALLATIDKISDTPQPAAGEYEQDAASQIQKIQRRLVDINIALMILGSSSSKLTCQTLCPTNKFKLDLCHNMDFLD